MYFRRSTQTLVNHDKTDFAKKNYVATKEHKMRQNTIKCTHSFFPLQISDVQNFFHVTICHVENFSTWQLYWLLKVVNAFIENLNSLTIYCCTTVLNYRNNHWNLKKFQILLSQMLIKYGEIPKNPAQMQLFQFRADQCSLPGIAKWLSVSRTNLPNVNFYT